MSLREKIEAMRSLVCLDDAAYVSRDAVLALIGAEPTAVDVLDNIRRAKYLNPSCAEHGCQWLPSGGRGGADSRQGEESVSSLALKIRDEVTREELAEIEQVRVIVSGHRDATYKLGGLYALDTLRQALSWPLKEKA